MVSACVFMSALCGPYFKRPLECHITCQCVGSYTLTAQPIKLHLDVEKLMQIKPTVVELVECGTSDWKAVSSSTAAREP